MSADGAVLTPEAIAKIEARLDFHRSMRPGLSHYEVDVPALLAAAKTVPDLLAEVKQLRGQVAHLSEELAEARQVASVLDDYATGRSKG